MHTITTEERRCRSLWLSYVKHDIDPHYSFYTTCSTTIWRDVCPCPLGSRCPYGKHCGFAPKVSGGENNNTTNTKFLVFQELKEMFRIRFATQKEKELPPPIKPKPKPIRPPVLLPVIKNVDVDEEEEEKKLLALPLYSYMRTKGIPFKSAICQCVHSNEELEQCSKTDNGLAHSIYELIQQFDNNELKKYYAFHFNRTKPYKLAPKFIVCANDECGTRYLNKFEIVATSYDDDNNSRFIEPVLRVSCKECHSVTIFPVYHDTQ